MASDRFKRIFYKSLAVHVGVILGVFIWPMISRLVFRPKPKDIVFIDLVAGMPEVPTVPVEETKTPEPQKEPEAKPEPEPKEDIPEPTKKRKIEVSKKKIKRQQPAPQKNTPKLSKEEIRKLLAAGAKPGNSLSGASDFPFAWYYALVRQTMYEAWNQPSGLSASAGLTADVTIRVLQNGTVTKREMTRPSGNKLMDDSVMAAVESVRSLRPLPPGFGGEYKDITIQFELSGMATF